VETTTSPHTTPPGSAAAPEVPAPALEHSPRSAEPRWQRWLPWALLALAALLLARLLTLGLWDPWETRAADLARQMSEAGAWLQPPGGLRLPPLPLWLRAASVAAFGTSEWALRLPGALASLGLLALLLTLGRRRFGLWPALGAAVALLSSSSFLLQAGLLLGQAEAMAAQAATLLLALELAEPPRARGPGAQWALAGGLAFAALLCALSGGILALALPALLAGLAWALRPAQPGWRWVALALAGGSVALALVAVWAPPGSAWQGLGVALHRFTAAADLAPPTFEGVAYQLAFGFFPWSLLLPAAAVVLVGRLSDPERSSAERLAAGFALAWLAGGLLLAVVARRLGGSPTLLALPAAALCVGLLAGEQPRSPGAARLFAAVLLLGAWVLGQGMLRQPAAWLDGLLGDATFQYPEGLHFPTWARLLVWAWLLALLCVALRPGRWLAARGAQESFVPARGLLRFLESPPPSWRRFGAGFDALLRGPRGTLALVLLGALLASGGALGLVPTLTHHVSLRSAFDRYEELRQGDQPLYVYRVPEQSAGYYLDSLPRLQGREQFLDKVAGADPAFCVIPRSKLAEINNAFRGRRQRHLTVLDERSSQLLLVANFLPAGAEDLNPIPGFIVATPPHFEQPVGAVLEGSLELLGATFSSPSVGLQGEVEVSYYFRVLRPTSRRWKVFVHMETPHHRIETARTDHEAAGGVFPTNTWRVGDIVRDTHRIKVPLFTPLGDYSLLIGLFVGDTRMRVDDPARHDGQNRINVGTLKVTAL